MDILGLAFDFLDGVLLGIQVVTPFFVTFAGWFYIEHVMAKDKSIKPYHQFVAFVLVAAVWVMASPQVIPAKVKSLSFVGIVPAVAIVILGGLSLLPMATKEKTNVEDEVEKLRSENAHLKETVKTLEIRNKYYEHQLYDDKEK